MNILVTSSIAALAVVGASVGLAPMPTRATTPIAYEHHAGAILGMWDCTADFGDGNELPFTMELEEEEGMIEGSLETGDGEFFSLTQGYYDSDTGELSAQVFAPGDDDSADFAATFADDSFEGEVSTPEGQTITIKGDKAE